MNLWFRPIWMLLTARLRGPLKLFNTAVLRLCVLPNDLDFNGHVNNGRYFTLADLGRLDFAIRTGSARIALVNRAMPLIGDAVAKFRKDLRPFQRFDLQTSLLGWDDKWISTRAPLCPRRPRRRHGGHTRAISRCRRAPCPKHNAGRTRACTRHPFACATRLGARLASQL